MAHMSRLRLGGRLESFPQLQQLLGELARFGAQSREPFLVEVGRGRRISHPFSEFGELLFKVLNSAGVAFVVLSVGSHGYPFYRREAGKTLASPIN